MHLYKKTMKRKIKLPKKSNLEYLLDALNSQK